MSDTKSIEYSSNSDSEESNRTQNDATCTILFLARPAPTKNCQKLRLRPKLILQVQMIRYGAHPMPVLGFWHPSILNFRKAKHSIPEADLCMSDIYVCQHEDYPFLKSDIAGQEDDIIAVIQNRSLKNGANASPIYLRGGKLVTAHKSPEGHYQCTWKDTNQRILTTKSCSTDGIGCKGSSFEIFDCTGVQMTMGSMVERSISLYPKECLRSGDDLHSTFNVRIFLIFAAWITIDKVDTK